MSEEAAWTSRLADLGETGIVIARHRIDETAVSSTTVGIDCRGANAVSVWSRWRADHGVGRLLTPSALARMLNPGTGEELCVIASVLRYVISDAAFFFFFFQAEDGIRDVAVTGVQTCALPI